MTRPACTRCGSPYPAGGLPELCPVCGGFWGYPEGIPRRPPTSGPEAGGGFARWAGALGLEPPELPDRALGSGPHHVAGVTVFQQGSTPTGTFKERGAEALAAECARRGIRETFLDSSGNAGLAVAGACAARGISCRVLVPSSTPAAKLERLAALGAAVDLVPGDRRAAAEAARALRGRLPYASHVYQPFFLAGVATLGWEIAAALPPGERRRIVLPAGNGSLLLGLALGLRSAGAMPAFHVVQLQGYAALAPEGPGTPSAGPPAAAGIAVADPPRREELRRTIEASGGDVTVVTEEEIARAREVLAGEGFRTDPTGAAAWAGLQKRPELRGPGREGTVVVLTSREG